MLTAGIKSGQDQLADHQQLDRTGLDKIDLARPGWPGHAGQRVGQQADWASQPAARLGHELAGPAGRLGWPTTAPDWTENFNTQTRPEHHCAL